MSDPSTAFGMLKAAVHDFISQQDGVATADSKGGTGLFGDLEMAIIAEEYARRRGKTFAPKKTAATGTARPSWGSGYRGMG